MTGGDAIHRSSTRRPATALPAQSAARGYPRCGTASSGQGPGASPWRGVQGGRTTLALLGACPHERCASRSRWTRSKASTSMRDSTFALMLEAQRAATRCGTTKCATCRCARASRKPGARQREERLFARARPVTVQRVRGAHYRFGDDGDRSISARMDVVLMRQDPPFDMAYITATHLLEHIHPTTLVVNDPASVRNAPEKLLVTHFPELMPPTLITWDLDAIRALPRGAQGHHRQAAVRQRRRRRVPHQAGRREPGRAAGDALRPLARAADVPALRARGAPGRQAHHPGGRRGRWARSTACRRQARRASNMHVGGRPEKCDADRARPRDLRRDRPDAAGAGADLRRHRRDRRLADRDQRDLADRHPGDRPVRRRRIWRRRSGTASRRRWPPPRKAVPVLWSDVDTGKGAPASDHFIWWAD